jgi:acetolactate synthase-1/2/3 large subunit
MAEAHAKVTGRPDICFVTRAPGATQASIGVHTAHQDSTPLILFIGQAARGFMEREAFQEVDYRRMFGQFAKWVAQIDDAVRVPEMVCRAFHTALAGRRGPVVLVLPEDVLSGEVSHDVGVAAVVCPPRAAPPSADMDHLLELLGRAERPLAILGGSGWTHSAVDDLGRFLRAAGVPVACSFRRQDLFDNRDPQYVGVLGLGADPGLHRAVKEADLLLLLGARMGEVASAGYTLIDSPQPAQTLVHAMPCPEELGRVYRPSLALLATMTELAQALAALAVPAALSERLQAWRERLRQGYERHSAPVAPRDDAVRLAPGTVDQAAAWCVLRERLPTNVVITNGAGNYTAWAHRYYRYPNFGSQVAPTSGAMGYGLPAAIGAKLACPQRPVLCLAGDGCFMMSSHEIVTAVRLRLPIVILLFDNGMFGTIRMHQERHFPERVYGTDLDNPDFVALARSHGALAQRIENVEALVPAVLAGFDAQVPTLLHVPTDPEQIGPNGTISSIRNDALPKRT